MLRNFFRLTILSKVKTAILITAYKNVHQIVDIINYFDDRFNFYIHFDKKNTPHDIYKLHSYKNVHVYNEYKVNWGSLNHLKAILFLCQEALKDQNNNYFHLISGQDFPTKPIDFYLNNNQNFLQFEKLPTESWNGNGGLNRYSYFNIFDHISLKNKTRLLKLNNWFINLQRTFKIERRSLYSTFKTIYGGGTWWSLSREALEFVVNNPNANIYLKRMRYCFCSEEIYFQSILMNSDFKQTIQNNNLRYIDWESNRGGIPSFLDSTDFDKIIAHDYLFARKFNDSTSEQLKNLLIAKNK